MYSAVLELDGVPEPKPFCPAREVVLGGEQVVAKVGVRVQIADVTQRRLREENRLEEHIRTSWSVTKAEKTVDFWLI